MMMENNDLKNTEELIVVEAVENTENIVEAQPVENIENTELI